MDTPIIAQYYRETEPEKRKELLEQAIASGEDQEANKIRKEIWEARYKGTTNEGGIADGYLKFWMALEFNRNAGHKVFGSGRAQKEIRKELDDVKFREIRAKVLFMKNIFTESASILSDFIWIFVKKTKTTTVYFADLSR